MTAESPVARSPLPYPSPDEDYSWLRAQCEYRLEMCEPGFAAREVVRAGDAFYDVQVAFTEPDGSVIFGDIGGQPRRGWDPEAGHGGIWRLRSDDSVEAIMPPGKTGRAMVLCPVLAPEPWGELAGSIFFVGQANPGRAGATRLHLVFRLPPGSDTPEVWAEPPHAGTAGGGVPGAMITGAFGREGGPHDGWLFVMSLMNRTVYRVGRQRRCEVFASLDPGAMGGVGVMPIGVFYATSSWGDLAGELILAGTPDSSFEAEAEEGVRTAYFLVKSDGIDPTPLPARDWGRRPIAVAPPEWGAFAGHTFSGHEGSVNLVHITKRNAQPLPHDARVLRIDPAGRVHDFITGLQGGSTSLAFAGDRLVIGSLRKSYSTGDYHEPDSSIYEVKPVR